MALGSKYVRSRIPSGLSPEDEDFLRRQMFSQIGTALMGNAFQGGSWSGAAQALQPMQQLPQQALQLMQFRAKQQEEVRQRQAEEVKAQMAMRDQAMQEDTFTRGQIEFGQGQEDRTAANRTRVRGLFDASEEQEHGGLARDKAVQEAEAYLASNEARLGPSAQTARAEIEALKMLPPTGLSRAKVAEWKTKFYPLIEKGVEGERDFDLKKRTENRLGAEAGKADDNTAVTVQGGSITVYDKKTSAVIASTPIPQTPETAQATANERSIAYDIAWQRLGFEKNKGDKLTKGQEEQLHSIANTILAGMLASRGGGSPQSSPQTSLESGPLGAFLSSLKPRQP